MKAAPALHVLLWTLILAALGGIIVAGCGGGGVRTPVPTGFNLTRTPVQAQLQLPAGHPIADITTLVPWSSGRAAPINTTGQAQVTIFNNGPQYVDVQDSLGRLVLMGYLSSTQTTTLSAESTAEAMVFLAIGGAAQIADGPKTVLEGIKGLPGFADVTAEVARQIQAQGFVSLQTGTLKDEIQEIITSVPRADGNSRGAIAEPTSASGLFLDTLTDGKLSIQNDHLRRVRGWLRRISYTDASGQTVEAATPFEKFDIEAPSRYGGFTGTVYSILSGEMVWTPKTSGPFNVPIDPPAAQDTTYELLTFGAGAQQGAFLNGQEEIAEHTEVVFKTLVLDTFLPILANIILPLNGEAMEDFVKFAGASPIMSDLINISRETLPEVYELVKDGEFRAAVVKMYETGFTSNTMVPLMVQMFISFGERFGPEWFFEQGGENAEVVAKRLALLGFVDVFFSATDMGIFIHDYNNSAGKNRFQITTTKGKATITFDDPIVSVFDTTLARAVIQNRDPNALYKFEWSVNEGFELTTSNGSTEEAPGGILASSDDFARVSTTTDDPGIAIVKCRVTRIDGEPDMLIDEPTNQMEFVVSPTILPESATVDLGGSVTFEGEYEGPYTALWKYTLETPNLGSINRTEMGTNPDCTFTAGQTTGTATLKIEVFIQKGTVTSKAYTTTRNISIGVANRVFPFSFNDVGTNGSELFWGRAATYIRVSKSLGSGTFTLYRNGVPFKSWSSGGDPPASANYPANLHTEFNWAVEVETRFRDDFTSPNTAESWGREQRTILFGLHHSVNNVWTIGVTPE